MNRMHVPAKQGWVAELAVGDDRPRSLQPAVVVRRLLAGRLPTRPDLAFLPRHHARSPVTPRPSGAKVRPPPCRGDLRIKDSLYAAAPKCNVRFGEPSLH